MARLIKIGDKHPARIEINGEMKKICMCGLSKIRPYCDGSHHQTHTEEEGKTYVYEEGQRKEV